MDNQQPTNQPTTNNKPTTIINEGDNMLTWKEIEASLDGHVMVCDTGTVIYKRGSIITAMKYADGGDYHNWYSEVIINIGCKVEGIQLERYLAKYPMGHYELVKIDGDPEKFTKKLLVDVSQESREESSMDNKMDRTMELVGKAIGVASGKGELAAKATGRWIRDTGAPIAKRESRNLWNSLKVGAKSAKEAYHEAKDATDTNVQS